MIEPPHFHLFGPSHWAVLIMTVAVPVGLALLVRRPRGRSWIRPIAYGLAALLVVNEVFEILYVARINPGDLKNHLPFQLCDWVIIACVVALLCRHQLAYELAYLWGLGGTLQAVLTPDLVEDFPRYHFFAFMIAHSGVIAAILFLTLGMRMRPYPRSILRAFLWSQIYLAVTAGVNLALGTNYGYLCHKPLQASLLDVLGPWPYYILSLEALGLVMFALVYAPFAVGDWLRRGRANA
ncbi:MAG TPA: TIGR02206 family membrane protein [Thermoanaerobaculia bacterium]|nr:TIGR02206 family membrane protein [Thermoanaerobaculia bacterium]